MGYHNRDAVTLRQWVEHLVKEPTVEGSAAAVKLVAALITRMPHRARRAHEGPGAAAGRRIGRRVPAGSGLPSGRRRALRAADDRPGACSGQRSGSAHLRRLGIEIFDSCGRAAQRADRARRFGGSASGALLGRTRSTSPRRSSATSWVTAILDRLAGAHILREVEGAGRRLPRRGGHPRGRFPGRRLPRRSAVPSAGSRLARLRLGLVSEAATPGLTPHASHGVPPERMTSATRSASTRAKPDWPTRPSTSTRDARSGLWSPCHASRTRVVAR